jgi:hypothetical protein
MISEISEESALAEGAEILSRRKVRLEGDAALRKRMRHSMVKEWMFWTGVALCFLNANLGDFSSASSPATLRWLLAVLFILTGMECAARKREAAMLDWIEYQKTHNKPLS